MIRGRQLAGAVEGSEELVLPQLALILRRRWAWLVGGVLLIVALGIGLSLLRTPSYQSTAIVLLRFSVADDAARSGTYVDPFLLSRDLSNEIRYAESDQVISAVTEDLGFLPQMSVAGGADADLLLFTATAEDPDIAANSANTWARKYVELRKVDGDLSAQQSVSGLEEQLDLLRERRRQINEPLDDLRREAALVTSTRRSAELDLEIQLLRDEISPDLALVDAEIRLLAESIAQARTDAGSGVDASVRVINSALPPSSPSQAPLSQIAILAVFVGAICGVALALLRDSLDGRVRHADGLERSVGLPVLAQISRDSAKDSELALATIERPESLTADGYYALRTALTFSRMQESIDSVLITSAGQGEGKTVTAANLAWSIATLEKRVVLLDGDFRRPRLHDVFGSQNTFGLTNYVFENTALRDLAIRVRKPGTEMLVFPTGPLPPSPPELFTSDRFRRAFRTIVDQHAFTVIDGPPVLPVSDALSLARLVDGVIVVARVGKTKTADVRRTLVKLNGVGANVIGLVLIGTRDADDYYGYVPDASGESAPRFASSEEAIVDLQSLAGDDEKPAAASEVG